MARGSKKAASKPAAFSGEASGSSSRLGSREGSASKKAAVIGNPVSHSLSPRLHGWWLERYGIAGSYDAVRLEKQELGPFLKSLEKEGYAGVNVTIPYKEEVLPFLDYVGESAELVGAVNTIIVREGKLLGQNTDVYGLVTHLHNSLKPGTRNLKPDKAVVIGAGGAARAAVAGILGELGFRELVILNRTPAKAEALRDHFAAGLRTMLARATSNNAEEIDKSVDYFASGITIGDWEHKEAALKDAALLVNTSSLGMVGQPALEIDLSPLPAQAVVYDIVFNPLETALLRQAREKGLHAVDGLGMLLHQAAPGFKAWFDPENTLFDGLPEVTPEQRAYVLEGLRR